MQGSVSFRARFQRKFRKQKKAQKPPAEVLNFLGTGKAEQFRAASLHEIHIIKAY
jgi:hypothetical protein